ncbi:MAG: sulfatase-like hydrolase/transferase [Anaeromyxobacter sp.]
MPGTPRQPRLRFPALLWSLIHVPFLVALYATSVVSAVGAAHPSYRAALWPIFLPQALLLGFIGWLPALPLSRWPRVYRVAAPLVVALFAAGLVVDSQIYRVFGFHLNGFFFSILFQPTAFSELALSWWTVGGIVVLILGVLALDVWAGVRFLTRFASPRRTWVLATAILALSLAERLYGQALEHFGGPAFFAASGVLPLQPPIRAQTLARKVFGGEPRDTFAGADEHRLPAGVDPAEVKFTRKPDVLFVVAESLPHDHLDEKTFPNLWRRSEQGSRFLRHYSTASATHFAIFSLFYGLQAQKLEATVGAGRRPVVFPAFRANGYSVHALAASCVDWMNLKETVFGGVSDALETWCDQDGLTRDRLMVARAEELARQTPPDQPLFVFLFFVGTHFPYPYEAQDKAFTPDWDGSGGIKATTAPGWIIKNRARNAGRTEDRVIEGFLQGFQAARGGREPLVIFTGDHGEEFRQKGHIAHGSAVTDEQIHVPLAIFGPGVPKGVYDAPTSHVDIAPTLLGLLGDTHPPSLYSDGRVAFTAPADRFVVATVGWEPQYAVIGKDLKVMMYAGIGSTSVTDPDDKPLPDGQVRMAAQVGRIMRALRGEPEPDAGNGGSSGPRP